jgi:Tfp pilus assembly protein PilF
MRLLSEIRNYMVSYHVKSGMYHYYRNEFPQAMGFLRKALADEPKLGPYDIRNARRYLTLTLRAQAERLEQKGEAETALEPMRQALEISPDWPDLHCRLAAMLRGLGRLDEAVATYREALRHNERYLAARVELGGCLLDAGRSEEAIAEFRQALEIKLEAACQPFDRGIALLEGGEIGSAREFLHETFLAAPELAGRHLGQALELLRQKEYPKALDELDRAVALHPKYPDLHNFRGITLCEMERHDDAAESFRRAAGLGGDPLVPRLNLAFCLLRAGRVRDAEAEFQAILALEPGEPVATAKLEELRVESAVEGRGAAPRGVR